MDTTITFTPAQMVEAVLAVCGAIMSVAAAAGVVAKVIAAIKAPNKHQDARLDEHKALIDRHEKLFANDNERLNTLEKGNRITQQALLALLSHGIDGNDIDALKKAKEALQEHLILK